MLTRGAVHVLAVVQHDEASTVLDGGDDRVDQSGRVVRGDPKNRRDAMGHGVAIG